MSATERISIRTTPHAKSLLEQASNLTGMSMSSFIIDSAYKQALALIEHEQRIVLNSEEWQNAIDLLDNPPKANNKMQDLFNKGYRIADAN